MSSNPQQQPQTAAQVPPHSSDPEEELPRVLVALQTVYAPNATFQRNINNSSSNDNDTPFDRRDVADRYLTSFQRTPVAWMVCDRLLSPSPQDEDGALRGQRQFFAAQTLHAKCRCDVHQLPRSSLPSLRESLLRHFVHHACDSARALSEGRPANRPLVTRLGMAIGSLAAQMMWTTCLQDVSRSVLEARPELGPAVLELFRSVPEEADSDRLVLADEDDLWAYRDHLKMSAHLVLGLCEHAVRTVDENDVATAEAVLSCLQSWTRCVDVDSALWERTLLLPWIFQLLADPSNGAFEMAVDVLVEILRTYSSDRRENEGLVRAIIPGVMALGREGGPFEKAVREEEEDGMRGYCRIFTEMGESYLSLILSHEEMNQQALVELVLRCSAIPDKEIAGITLNFWYRFVTGLEDLEPFQYRQIRIDHFAPQITRLLTICTNLLRYPIDVDDLSPDRLDDMDGLRFYFADTIEDCCRLLGGEAVLSCVADPLQEECRRVASLPQGRQLAEWHGIEAYLFAIQAMSLYVPSDEPRIISFVMGLVPQLPPEVPLLRSTASLTVGKYASWLAVQPGYLQPLLPYLAQGLSVPKCASSSAVAIREICERCYSLGDAVVQLYDGIVAAREAHQQQLRSGVGGEEFILDLKNELEVLEGVCKSITYKLRSETPLTPETMNGYIQRLAQPIIANLKTIAPPEHSASPKQVSAEICRLTVLVQHLCLPRPSSHPPPGMLTRSNFILSLMQETWPLLDSVSRKHPRDFNCSEKLCRLHKHALRECGAVEYTPMLQPLIEQIIKNFSLSLLSPYLYLASICISEYGRNPDHTKQLYEMVASLSSTIFYALRTSDDLASHPDVVEEFFFLTGRMVTYCPSPLVQSPLLNSLLQCAALGMKLHHKDANRGTLNFLECTVSYGLKLRTSNTLNASEQADRDALERAVLTEGQPLVINLAQALLGDLPAYRLDSGSGSIAGVLFHLNQLCPELLMQWIQPPLTMAPEHARSAFLGTLSNKAAREEFFSSVRKFTIVCERSRKRGDGASGEEPSRR